MIMKKVSAIIFAVMTVLIFAISADAAGLRVEWNAGRLTAGELSVSVYGAEEGATAILALYDGEMLSGVRSVKAENGAVLSLEVGEVSPDSKAKLFLWDRDSLTPAAAVLSTVTPEGVVDGSARNGPALGTLSGVVWNDADRDGNMDEGENEGIAGVTVTLSDGQTAVTDKNGEYAFRELPVGEYTVQVTVPEDYICTTENQTAEVSVTEDAEVKVNVGIAINVGSLSGVVWNDVNRNGVRDEDETVFSGIEVTLSSGGSVITDGNGTYVFDRLKPGTYSVSASVPSDDYEAATNNEEIEVLPGENTESNIGLVLKPGSIVGYVWIDSDWDGEIDYNETVMKGVTVTRDGESPGLPVTETDSSGRYSFEGLTPGEYTVTVTLPVNTEAIDAVSVIVTVEPGKPTEANFRLAKATILGHVEGLVWNDDNGNGIQDEGEDVVQSATITLTNASSGVTNTAKTGVRGTYTFYNVIPGDYTIEVSTGPRYRKAYDNPRQITVISGSKVSADFGIFQLWLSDDQQINYDNEGKGTISIAYHDIDPIISGEYSISFELFMYTQGDNAIMLGDSSNGRLAYNTSSAILLFPKNNGYFGVRTGNGNGGYTDSAQTNLCPANLGETYTVTFNGNIDENTYTVSITGSDGKTYTSGVMHARTNGAKIDTVALISNSHKTEIRNGYYSNYYFYVDKFKASGITVTPDEPVEIEYNGFAGMYYGITVNGKYIRGNNGRISADYTSVRDVSAQFLPRDMADGTFALLCRSSNRRITTAAQNSQLTSGDYATNDLTQHWILEESENYAPDHLSYYLKSADNGLYIGVSRNYLTAVNEANKVELVFEPLTEESPLYQVSRTEAYARLTAAQRERIVTLYETVAGDVFGRYGGTDYSWGARGRLDAAFEEVLFGDLSEDAQYERLAGMLSGENGYLIQTGNIASYTVSTSLPGTENLRYEIDDGTYGNYDFWRGTMLDGTMYNLKIYDGDELQQTIKLYVHDDGTPRQNSQTFLSVITKIPYVYRKNIRNVKIRSDNANSFNCGASDLYIRLNYHMSDQNRMLGTLTHELNHSLDQSNGSWSHGSPWASAMADDMIMATEYARTSVDEDFAEFGRLYVLCYGNQDRQKALQLLFPNRYASYWRLRHNNLGGFELWEDSEYMNN